MPTRTRIKICGIRDPHTALIACECGADAIGVVLAPGSPRTVTSDEAWEVVAAVPPFVTTVGLFVNAKPEQYLEAAHDLGFDLGQLHGKEAEPVVRECGPGIIKAIQYDSETIEHDLFKWSRITEVNAVLVDGGSGGTGERADWAHLAQVAERCDHPLILAGGLTPENVGEAIRLVRPWAVDVSSGVESERGVKDPALIEAFCEAVRQADARLNKA
ncbi:MAG: phosphoribosylanthranilate isomerase [Phycisphaerales bacterium]|nr:phosphoribosylanthranilate isomerase [Phycisphaerales bacterium]